MWVLLLCLLHSGQLQHVFFRGSVGMSCSRKKGEGEYVKGEISTMVMTLLRVLPSHTATTVPHSLTGRDILAMFSDSGKGMSTR